VPLQIQGFYQEVSSLLLTGVQAVYVDSEVDLQTLTRSLFRQYFNGSELIVAGKLMRQNQTALQVYVQATGVEGRHGFRATMRYDHALVVWRFFALYKFNNQSINQFPDDVSVAAAWIFLGGVQSPTPNPPIFSVLSS
jgi:hypothetical protein